MKKFLLLAIIFLSFVFVYTKTNLFNTSSFDIPPSQEAVLPSPTLSLERKTQQQTACSGKLTPTQAEGPYYKTGSPKRNNVAESVLGEKLVVTGSVYDRNCRPITNAWLDFWQANSNGVYDNTGYRLRGHQFTDDSGRYSLETVVPSAYESRPPHIHVKVKASDGPVLTSQMYFPGEAKNQTDSIFNQNLVMKLTDAKNGKVGEFNFVLNQ